MAKSKKKRKSKTAINKDFIAIIVILVAALIFISNIGLGGSVGGIISGFLFGIMGIIAFVFPFYLLFVCFLFLRDKNHPIKNSIITSSIFILLCLSAELISITKSSHVNNPVDSFAIGKESHIGGGFFGGCFSFVFTEGFGLVGAYIIDLICILILVIYFRRKSIISSIFDRDPKLAKEKRAKRKTKRLKRLEKKRIRKEESKSYKEKTGHEIDDFVDSIEESDIETIPVSEPEPEPEPIPRINNKVRGIDFGTLDDKKIESTPDQINHIVLKPVEGHEDIAPTPLPENTNVELISIDPIEPELPPIDDSFIESQVLSDSDTDEPILNIDPSYFDDGDIVKDEPEIEVEPIIIEPEIEVEPIIEEPEIEVEPIIEEPEIEEVTKEPIIEENIIEEEPEPIIDDPIIDEIIEQEHIEEHQVEEHQVEEHIEYRYPLVSLLAKGNSDNSSNDEDLNETADKLVNTLNNFGVDVTISEISRGPAVTRFELIPSMGVKVSKILNLADDIKLNLAAADIRIEAPIPGKSAVGIEVPNKNVDMVHFRDLIDSSAFRETKSPIAFGAGKDLGGNIIISDIAKMPHVLIAGATGSGKSVCINTIIMSILFKAKPSEVKFIMIDPKVVELSVYNGIPHLLIPVVSDPKKAAGALNWAVREMNDRYQKFAEIGVRDMAGYNKKIAAPDFENKSGIHVNLPQIVVIVDELADLMMVSSSEVEESICRLAQLARAAGIHLVIATQRPSVNVITGLIKANMPSRIAFAVTSGVDSRTILDMNGAEKLLGKGDMLYFPQGNAKPIRVQGAFVSDDEVMEVVDYIKSNNSDMGIDSKAKEEIEKQISEGNSTNSTSIESNVDDGKDEYFAAAGRLIIEKEKGSIGMLQRNFKIGFNRAARIMDQLTEAGVVGPEEGTKPRKVLVSIEEFESIVNGD